VTTSGPYEPVYQLVGLVLNRQAGKDTPDYAALTEISERLIGLDRTFTRLMSINSALSAEMPRFELDPKTEQLRMVHGDRVLFETQLNRANPDVPVRQTSSTHLMAYTSGAPVPGEPSARTELKRELAELVERYYYSAHRLLKVAQRLPGLKNVKCKEMILVRNKLVEHADHGDPYTFGVTPSGPRVRPVSVGIRQWTDPGLLPNTESFVRALTVAFAPNK
jgi:hypothetical protein